MTKAQKLMQENPDLDLGGYTDSSTPPAQRNQNPLSTSFPNKDSAFLLYDELRDVGSNHNQKSYEYIHDLLDILKDQRCILKSPNVGNSSYGWKHKVETYTRKLRAIEYGFNPHSHHWIANGLFIAVLRERGLPERRCDTLNAWVPFGVRAAEYCNNFLPVRLEAEANRKKKGGNHSLALLHG